jgi:hypothetical protein
MDWATGLIKYAAVTLAGIGYGLIAIAVMIALGTAVFVAYLGHQTFDEDFEE